MTKNVGRIRSKLCKLLQEKGFQLTAEDLQSNYPYYRRAEQDGVAWEAYAKYNGRTVQLHSWDTMTNCVQKGITASPVYSRIDKGDMYEVSSLD